MITTTKKINLAQLDAELKAGGLNMESLDGLHTITAINDKITDSQLQAGVEKHNAIDQKVQAAADKAALLAKLGISQDDLKTLLS